MRILYRRCRRNTSASEMDVLKLFEKIAVRRENAEMQVQTSDVMIGSSKRDQNQWLPGKSVKGQSYPR